MRPVVLPHADWVDRPLQKSASGTFQQAPDRTGGCRPRQRPTRPIHLSVIGANCNGDRGQGIGEYQPLVGGHGTLKNEAPVLAVGSYRLFDDPLGLHSPHHRHAIARRKKVLSFSSLLHLSHMNGKPNPHFVGQQDGVLWDGRGSFIPCPSSVE